MGSALILSLLMTPQYEATTLLYLSPVAGQEMKVDKVVDNEMFQLRNRRMYEQTQLRVIRSRTLLEKVIREFNGLGYTSLTPDVEGVEALAEMMRAIPQQGTELLAISVRSPDAEQAAVLANLVAEVYQRHTLDTHQGAALGAQEWIEDQLAEWSLRIDDANRARLAFQRENGVAASSASDVTALGARADALNAAFGTVSTERVVLETTIAGYNRLLEARLYEDLANDMGTPLLVALSNEYADAVLEEAQLTARYGERHPKRIGSTTRLEAINHEIALEVERALKAENSRLGLLRERESSLMAEIEATDLASLGAEVKKAEFARLDSELSRAREFYATLSQRFGEVELQSETQLSYLRVVEPAIPSPDPVSPRTLLNLLAGCFLGLLGGMAVALGREYFDDTVGTRLDVSVHLGVPFLGFVPKIDDDGAPADSALHTLHNPRSLTAEAVRGIRTVLELNPTGAAPRRLLVTSAVSSEGKTTAVVLLGVGFANLGRRVLLVDGDLRRPRLHKVFGTSLTGGLTSYIRGTPLAEVVHKTEVANLDLLPAGRSGDSPTELLAAAGTGRMLEAMNEDYDLVIVDSPPSMLLSDTQVLSPHVDGVIMVVREMTASRRVIRGTISGLQQVGGKLLGVIINDVDLGRRGKDAYEYGYGYGYGYGLARDSEHAG